MPSSSSVPTTPSPAAPDVSIVVPVYNEAESLEPLTGEIRRALAERREGWELLYIDDGSTDAGLDVLRRLAAADGRLRILRMAGNSGQSAALAVGFAAARGGVVVTLDADLQNDPADIPRLLDLLEGADLVSGIRRKRRDTWARRVASKIANRVRSRLLGDGITDVGCSLKAYRAEFLRDLPAFNGMHRFLPALVRMAGAQRVEEVEVNHRPRQHGESKYTIGGRLRRSLADLLAMLWLRSRWIDRRGAEELEIDRSSNVDQDDQQIMSRPEDPLPEVSR